MTALNGPILFNNSAGSDSLASGLGPSTPVNSTTEGTTASYSGTTITFSGATDLSGVSAGDLLYLVTSTGRKFFVIASVDDGADSLTVDDAPTGTASGLSWAIGGKRATLSNADSLAMFTNANAKDGWIIEIEETGSPYTISADIEVGASIDIQGDTGHVEIEQTANDYNFSLQSGTDETPTLKRLKLTNSNGTKTNAIGIFKSSGVNGGWRAEDCIIGDSVNTLSYGVQMGSSGANRNIFLRYCEVQYCTTYGIYINNTHQLDLIVCNVHHNAIGVYQSTGSGAWLIAHSIISHNTSHGLSLTMAGALYIVDSILASNGGDGLDIIALTGGLTAFGNIISSNGGYGVSGGSESPPNARFVDANAFYANMSGTYENYSAGPNDVTLSADPFVNAASGDFNINNDAGGGASLRAATLTMPG